MTDRKMKKMKGQEEERFPAEAQRRREGRRPRRLSERGRAKFRNQRIKI